MSLIRQLKPDHDITGLLIHLSILPIFGLSVLIFDLYIGMLIMSGTIALFALFYLYVFIRTWNIAQLVISAECVFFIYMFIEAAQNIEVNHFESVEFGLAYYTGVIFFGVLVVYMAVTRKMKWRGREIFELAGEMVSETGDGYTSRPRPVGKVEYTPEEMRAFARFCARHLIALPYSSSKNITLVPIKMGQEFGRLLGLSGDYRYATWVNFDMEGEVSVHIAHRDYLDYREPLAFDALCSSLGQVFIDFFELYRRGEGVRAIDRMDALKLGVFS